MAILEKIPAIQKLSDGEKRSLIGELWEQMDGAAAEAASPEIVELLERRLEHYRRNPESASTWEAVKKRLQTTRG